MLSTVLLLTLASANLKVGDVAPDFTVRDIDGKDLTLSKLVAEGPVVLAFFPKAYTGGCTREMEAYRDRFSEVEKLKGKVIAVSTDDVEKLKKWRTDLKAPQTFVADPQARLINQFTSTMPIIGLSSRATFVIGPERKILSVQEGGDAVDVSGAIAACSLHKPAAPAAAPVVKPVAPVK